MQQYVSLAAIYQLEPEKINAAQWSDLEDVHHQDDFSEADCTGDDEER